MAADGAVSAPRGVKAILVEKRPCWPSRLGVNAGGVRQFARHPVEILSISSMEL